LALSPGELFGFGTGGFSKIPLIDTSSAGDRLRFHLSSDVTFLARKDSETDKTELTTLAGIFHQAEAMKGIPSTSVTIADHTIKPVANKARTNIYLPSCVLSVLLAWLVQGG
jgi:hypothetical protein